MRQYVHSGNTQCMSISVVGICVHVVHFPCSCYGLQVGEIGKSSACKPGLCCILCFCLVSDDQIKHAHTKNTRYFLERIKVYLPTVIVPIAVNRAWCIA